MKKLFNYLLFGAAAACLAFALPPAPATSPGLSIQLDKDTVEIGKPVKATFTHSYGSSVTFQWKYVSFTSSVASVAVDTLYASGDTLTLSYTHEGAYRIWLYAIENGVPIDSTERDFVVHGSRSLPCTVAPPDCDLVCNGNFETQRAPDPGFSHPDRVYGHDQLSRAIGYDKFGPQTFYSSTGGIYIVHQTPDYFTADNMWGFNSAYRPTNACINDACVVGVPRNTGGYQESHNGGSAYGGIISYMHDPIGNWNRPSDYQPNEFTREYIVGALVSPLQAGQTYHVKFYVNLANNSGYAIDKMGLKFVSHHPSGSGQQNTFPNGRNTNFKYNVIQYGNNSYPQITTELIYSNGQPIIPDVMNTSGILSDTLNWIEISGTYTPVVSGENFFIIGNFSNDANTNVQHVGGNVCMSDGRMAFYYVDDISVTLAPELEITASANPICYGESVTLTATPGFETYSWSSGQSTANITVSPTQTTTYILTATLNGCTRRDTVTVTVHPEVVANAGQDVTICYGGQTTLGGISTQGNAVWSPATGLSCTNCFTPTASPTQTTTYTLSVTSPEGCIKSDEVTVTVTPAPELQITGATTRCCDNLCYEVTNPSNYTSIQWTVQPGNLNYTGSTLCLDENELQPGGFTISVSGTMAGNCLALGELQVEDCCDILTDLIPFLNHPYAYHTENCAPTNLSDYLGVWPWVTSTTSVMPGGFIFVHEDLHIDRNITIQNSYVFVRAGKKITVAPGISLNIQTSQFSPACLGMWDGIFASDATSSISSTESQYYQAENAIVVEHGASLFVNASTFNDCHKGIIIREYAPAVTYPATVMNSTFQTTATRLISPRSGQQMHKGVEVQNVHHASIGDKNRFNTGDFGIHTKNAGLTAQNNDFRNFRTASTNPSCSDCGCPSGTAICTYNAGTGQYFNVEIGGGTVGGINIFEHNDYGTMTLGLHDISFQKNQLLDHSVGLFVMLNPGATIEVEDNSFDTFAVGAALYQVPKANVQIHTNTFNNGVGSPPAISNTAILIHNPTGQQSYRGNISENVINRVRNGIYLLGANGATGLLGVQIQARANEINFDHLSGNNFQGQTHYGIRLENSRLLAIHENEISKSGVNPNAGSVGWLRGLGVHSSQGAYVYQNEFTRMAEGVWVYGTAFGGGYACNDFTSTYHGFKFTGPSSRANISDQLQLNTPTGNRWLSRVSGGYDLAGGIAPQTHWWYNGSGAYLPTSDLLQFSTWGAGVGTQAESTTVASTCPARPIEEWDEPRQPVTRERALGAIVRDELVFEADEYAFTMYNLLHAYSTLSDFPDLLTLGEPDDSLYQQFYTTHSTTDIGKLHQVYKLIGDGEYTSAATLNQSLTDTSDWLSNAKEANRVFLMLAIGKGISGADSTLLYGIAYQNAAQGGPGVFAARSLLWLDVQDEENGQTRSMWLANEESPEAQPQVSIYPNPSEGQFTVAYDLAGHTSAQLVITDVLGRVVFEKTLDQSTGTVQVSSLSVSKGAGVYLCRVMAGNVPLLSEKLIFTK